MRWLGWLVALVLVVGCGEDSKTTSGTATGTGTGTSTGTGSGTASGTASATSTGTSTGVGGSGGGGVGGSTADGSLFFQINNPNEHDHGIQTTIPAGFGDGEFTFELWMRLDDSYPIGPTDGGQDQLTNWCDTDNMPYAGGTWWYDGNFLIDGHNNGAGFNLGTFSLQFYGGGRLRWHLGDGGNPSGGTWGVEVYPANNTPTLLTGTWHQVTLVRRWAAGNSADLEMWINGALVATETTPNRTDMRTWWDSWATFSPIEEGWWWGSEKQAAYGGLSQYEDFKGNVAEVRFWSIAKSASVIQNTWQNAVTGGEAGLVGWFPLNEGAGVNTCDVLDPNSCIALYQMKAGYWSAAGPPLQ